MVARDWHASKRCLQEGPEASACSVRCSPGNIAWQQPGALVGESSTAVTFTNSYIYASGASDLPADASPRSLEAWFQSTSSQQYQDLVGYGTQSNGHAFGMRLLNGNQLYVYFYGWMDHTFTAPYQLTDGRWHHVVETYDGSSITVFLDGQSFGVYSVGVLQTQVPGSGLFVGSGTASPFPGSLDEVAVYWRVLTQAQVKNHWQIATAITCPVGAPNTTYVNSVLGTTPVQYYRLGEQPSAGAASDISGNCETASYGRAAHLGSSGVIIGDADTAAAGDGSGTIAYQSGADLPSGSSPRSMEAWVQSTSSQQYQDIAGYGTQGNGQAFGMRLFNGNQLYVYFYGWMDHTFVAPHSITDGSWHYLVVTYDGSVITVYLDGQSFGTQTIGQIQTLVPGSGLFMGSGTASPFPGSIDEVAIYDHVLTPQQVSSHWAASGR